MKELEHEAVDEVVGRLADEYGADAVLGELSKGKGDPFVAAFEIYSLSGHRLREFFTGEEIVRDALSYLTADDWTGGIAQGSWAWSALFEHYVGSVDHFDDDEHAALVLDLLAATPMDDGVLFRIGDGPLAHAVADRLRRAHPRTRGD